MAHPHHEPVDVPVGAHRAVDVPHPHPQPEPRCRSGVDHHPVRGGHDRRPDRVRNVGALVGCTVPDTEAGGELALGGHHHEGQALGRGAAGTPRVGVGAQRQLGQQRRAGPSDVLREQGRQQRCGLPGLLLKARALPHHHRLRGHRLPLGRRRHRLGVVRCASGGVGHGDTGAGGGERTGAVLLQQVEHGHPVEQLLGAPRDEHGREPERAGPAVGGEHQPVDPGAELLGLGSAAVRGGSGLLGGGGRGGELGPAGVQVGLLRTDLVVQHERGGVESG